MSTANTVRIGVLTKPLDNWKSGSGHHLDELMKAVLDLNDTLGKPVDFSFIHYAVSENPIYNRVREIIIPRFPAAASAIIRREGFDLVHYSPLTIMSPIGCLSCIKTATVHGIEEELYPEGYSLIERLHACYILPLWMRRMDGIATVSETGKRYFVEHYGCAENRICITTNGLSPSYRVLEDVKKEKIVLHISRYSKRKNPRAILSGFSHFLETRKNDRKEWKLVCAGSHWDDEEAYALASEAGIRDQYVAPGFVSEQDAVTLLNSARVFLFPSFAEGFGMPNVEAMACGCPVITSSIFAIPEVVGDAAILLKNPRDDYRLGLEIARIVDNPEMADSLRARGLERSRLYNWQDSARTLMTFWQSLIEDSRV